MNGTIIVTGASGTVGSETIRQLIQARAKVRAGIRTKDNAWKTNASGAEFVEIDFNNEESLLNGFRGADTLFLITPFSDNMVEMTRKAVNAAKNAGINHIVKLSAMGAAPDSKVTPIRWHYECENIIKESGIPYTILRPNFFMQNFITFFGDQIKDKKTFYAPAGKGEASLVDVRDVAAAAVTVLTKKGHEGKTYTLTGCEANGYRQMEYALGYILGTIIRYHDVDPETAEQQMKASGMPDWMVKGMLELYEAYRENKMAEITKDIPNLTGHKARTLRQFVQDYKDSFKK